MTIQLKDSLKYQGSIIRPRFAPGIMLLDEDLTAAVEYPRTLIRLLFRSLFGCGVVCGFEVTAGADCGQLKVTVKPGVALDGHGDPIELCSDQTVGLPCEEKRNNIWLVICRSGERSCVPRDVACPGDDDSKSMVPTRTRDCFEIKLLEENDVDKHICQCQPAGKDDVSRGNPDNTTGIDRTNTASAGPELLKLLTPQYWDCHHEHYCGACSCGCCANDCVVLAKLTRTPPTQNGTPAKWEPDYSVRRFIRPMLAPNPWLNGDPMKCRPQQRETPPQQLGPQHPVPQGPPPPPVIG
ncbi:hypothetical protein M2189_001694 [Bradyrhizobium japonicum]|uniref:hypothetical protein n=1 Tax=Bradyrhizobium japonicum TaxID=375 RepID=UPI002169BC7A|nr:hypothetical protein [Bradyrhizobium japonicum]MCS3499345.1 hypothetical protein [Bradyrhizobium japonicum]MCS3958491.1 hypothetical protein [Bradyrhizobium japonicum]MCS4000245.1 hypothetical protein [Bradyrhizobium japonicum]